MSAVEVIHGDCLDALADMDEASVDAICTDPPYGLEFMGRDWDRFKPGGKRPRVGDADGTPHRRNSGTPSWAASGNPVCRSCRGTKYDRTRPNGCKCATPDFPNESAAHMRAFQAWCEQWATVALWVLKPGGHLLAFGGTRTHHRLTCAIEDAGFEIRDCIMYMYGTGFPKSLNPGCRCGHDSGTEPAPEHDLRPVRHVDVPPTLSTEGGQGSLLLQGMQEPSASQRGTAPRDGPQGVREPGVEGWCDAQASEGQLRRGPAREGASLGVADGEVGRLHRGASARDGTDGRSAADADGSRQPQGSRPVEQPTEQPRAVAGQRQSQARRGWPICGRCGQPTGLGTALKPAWEPIVVARKPLVGTVAANVAEHGTGALNIDGCRIGTQDDLNGGAYSDGRRPRAMAPGGATRGAQPDGPFVQPTGRWPANVVLDEDAADQLDQQTGMSTSGLPRSDRGKGGIWNPSADGIPAGPQYGDSGGASRFFYCAKASAADRGPGNAHPTVKPTELIRWLIRLVTPPDGVVVDPFAGSGTTGVAATVENRRAILIEQDAEYVEIIRRRLEQPIQPVLDL